MHSKGIWQVLEERTQILGGVEGAHERDRFYLNSASSQQTISSNNQ
jgi:hypothetical protein